MVLNKYPLWKNLLLLVIILLALLYAVPNIFGEDPAVQISSATSGAVIVPGELTQVQNILQSNQIPYKSAILQPNAKSILIRFNTTDDELKAKEMLPQSLGDQYIVAINFVSAAPKWLTALGATPIKLGLDLRGGVHFLLQVDTSTVINHRLQGDVRNVTQALRQANIRYTGINLQPTNNQLIVSFANNNALSSAQDKLEDQFSDYQWVKQTQNNNLQLVGSLTADALQKIQQNTIEQSMNTLRNRVNELGVSEATVQQQGVDRIAVDLPGIQDATQAQNIIGNTATLEFHLVDLTHDPQAAAVSGIVPPGLQLFNYNGQPVLLKDQVVLTGSSITSANSSFDENGRPAVLIRLGGGGETEFYRITGDNIGKPLAVVYVETKSQQETINGKKQIVYTPIKRVINIATIQSALGSPFQVTGLDSPDEARDLALLLRAGSLPAAITIIEDRTVGPSMGKQNVARGMLSVEVGLIAVVIFMALYYGVFGLIADIGLVLNLILVVAILSMLGAVLTFPGIAAMVLTIGMAVDANVLIFERIREELRNGVSMQAAIHAGYEKAFNTIVDANVTTLIAAIVLFGIGSGAIKGFAITLIIGLLTSMLTGIVYTRAIVNFIYGGRRLNWLSIGIKNKKMG